MANVIAVTVEFSPSRSDVTSNIIEIPSDMKWSDFDLVLRLAFGLEGMVVKYYDEEDDLITMKSDDELKEAFRVARRQKNVLRLNLCDAKTTVINAPVQTALASVSASTVKSQPGTVRSMAGGESKTETSSDKAPSCPLESDNRAGAVGRDLDALYSDSSSDDSIIMEADESNKDTTSSPDSSSPHHCFILKHVKSSLVLDVEGWSRTAGTRVILYPRKPNCCGTSGCENQLFMEDEETGTVRSYFCGLCLDATENGLTIQPFSPGKLSQKWKLVGNKLQNGEDRPYWVIGVDDREGHEEYESTCPAALLYQGSDNQHWEADFCSLKEEEPIPIFLPLHNMANASQHKKNLYAELAREMSLHLHQVEGGGAAGGQISDAPKWFTEYMEQFKKDLCEEISNMVTRKTVRRILNGLMEGGVNPGRTSSESDPDMEQKQRLVHHFGVMCDACEQPINGVRYKCGNCEDFDLCDACETKVVASGGHDSDHVFIKIRRPAMAFPRKKTGKPVPLLKRSLYPTDEEIQRIQEKMLRKQDKYRRRGEKHEEKMKRREDKLKRRHEFLREIPSKKEKLEFPLLPMSLERLDSHFVRDENYHDGCTVEPDIRISKRWVMRNTGTHAWPENTKLTLLWGNIPPMVSEVDVPSLGPMQEGAISVDFITPAYPGVYQSHWRMSHKNFRFGHRVWCSLVVALPDVNDEVAVETGDRQVPTVNEQTPTDKMEEVTDKQEEQEQAVKSTLGEEDVIIDVEAEVETMVQENGTQAEGSDDGAKVVKQQKKKSSAETDILSAQDILSFELLDIRDRNTPKVSQTATPTNTPMAMTPPKSPVREMEEEGFRHLSTSSSVEIVSESSEESTSHMTELVQERIAKLGLKPDHHEEIETISTCSEDSDSDSDFYIVPLPDCFNPNMPLSASTSTSVVMSREEVQKTVDDILSASKNLGTPSLIPEVIDLTNDLGEAEGSMVHVDLQSTSEDVSLLAFEASLPEVPLEEVTVEISSAPEAQSVSMETVPAPSFAPIINAPPQITTDENANSVPSTPEAAIANLLPQSPPHTATSAEEAKEVGGALEEAMEDEGTNQEEILASAEGGATSLTDVKRLAAASAATTATTTTAPTTTATATTTTSAAADDNDIVAEPAARPDGINIPQKQTTSSNSSTPHTPPSPSVLASSLMTAAIGVATQAAATAYTTAKDVFHTLQASKEYVPPKSNWKPPQQKWSPPANNFSLPEENWTPPKQDWTPAQQDWTPPMQDWTPPEDLTCPLNTQAVPPPPRTHRSEMDQLVEMGFADRQLNAALLKKFDNDVQKVVQELVSRQDNDWSDNRH